MSGIYWKTRWLAQDYMRTTNIPPSCWLYDSRYHKPYGWYAAYPYVKGSLDYSGLAHYRERVGRSCGSGAYFNAFREIVSFSDRDSTYIDEQAYLTKGKYYYLGNEYGSIVVLDGASLLMASFHVEWKGDTVSASSWTWWPIAVERRVCDDYPNDPYFKLAEYKKEVRVGPWQGTPFMSPEELVDYFYSGYREGAKSIPWSIVLREPGSATSAPLPELDGNPNLFNWKDKEYWSFCAVRDLGLVLPPYGSMVSQAYTEAIASFPEVHSNVLANILDLISLAKSILSGNPLGKVIKESNGEKVKDAWLAYRYSYTTTKLDYEELTSFVRRIGSLPKGDITLRSSVHFSHTTVRCSVVLPMSDVLGELGNIENLGLKLSATNAWDLIPYSFVVDWFLRISDWLDYFETQGFALTLHPKEVWYSIRTNYEGQTTYFRWQGVPALGLPFDLYTAVSNKTALMRIGDSIALFT